LQCLKVLEHAQVLISKALVLEYISTSTPEYKYKYIGKIKKIFK